MVIKDLEDVLAPVQHVRMRRIVLPQRGADNLGEGKISVTLGPLDESVQFLTADPL